jgi:hypothetical protein
MAEEPDFLTRVETISRNWTGEEWKPERALEEFTLYDAGYRASVLDDFDRELASADTSDLRRYSKMTSMRQKMDNLHHALRKAGR